MQEESSQDPGVASEIRPHGSLPSAQALWLVGALVAWALALTTLLERGPYGLDEATARAILFLWSISDAVASPIVTLGVPDFRAIYLIPAGVPFSGSLLAAKLCTVAVVLAAVAALYGWRRRGGDTESPLPASGLMLLSPLVVAQIDSIAIGPFLLLTFALGAWADRIYRDSRVRFGGMYFAQLLLCLTAATLHPAGLALPLALTLSWLRRQTPPPEQPGFVPGSDRTHVLTGIGIATLIGVLLASGWRLQPWFVNPLTGLAGGVFGLHPDTGLGETLFWVLGALMLLGWALTLWRTRGQLHEDVLLATLALAGVIALATGDSTCSLLVLTVLLYWGFALLLRVRVGAAGGFVGQRGVAFALLVVLSTAFLSADRTRYERVGHGAELSAQDRLIETLATSIQQGHAPAAAPGAASGPQKAPSGPRVASQWPGRTMIACRCSALPLPPAVTDQDLFLANLRGIDYVLFDPKNPDNRVISQDFAMLGGAHAETLALQPGGVLLQLHAVREPPPPPLPSGPGGVVPG
jgi:hypothetical protein